MQGGLLNINDFTSKRPAYRDKETTSTQTLTTEPRRTDWTAVDSDNLVNNDNYLDYYLNAKIRLNDTMEGRKSLRPLLSV